MYGSDDNDDGVSTILTSIKYRQKFITNHSKAVLCQEQFRKSITFITLTSHSYPA
jgi:hypothetical protein